MLTAIVISEFLIIKKPGSVWEYNTLYAEQNIEIKHQLKK